MKLNDIEIDDSYFTDETIARFKGKEKEFLEYLKTLLQIAIDELLVTTNFKDQIDRGKVIKKFEKHLKNIGFLKNKKSINNDLYLIVRKSIQNINFTDKGSLIINSNYQTKFKNFEQQLYKDFKELIQNRIQKDLQIEFKEGSATKQYSGKWVNPDILFFAEIDGQTIYFSYEIKRWNDMDPIAPHEARNHARVISNYPNVAIHIPKDLMEFVIEYNNNFQIIKEDCKERGIGLFIFDPQEDYIFKLFDANYFEPDPIKKRNYLEGDKNDQK